jgi:hypothetical protein
LLLEKLLKIVPAAATNKSGAGAMFASFVCACSEQLSIICGGAQFTIKQNIFSVFICLPYHIMFGALNRFIGRLDSEAVQNNSNGPGDNSFGFQILRNKDGDLPLEPWFDFIIGINGRLIVRQKNFLLRVTLLKSFSNIGGTGS